MSSLSITSLKLRAPLFLSIGECMVEMAPDANGNHKMGFAGDTFNMAWYARRMLPGDWSVSYLTAIGSDKTSSRMLGFFRSSGLDTSSVQIIPGKTPGLYLIDTKDGERSFTYWRSDSAARRLADDKPVLSAALSGAGLVYFSGITLAILSDQTRALFLAAIAVARGQGAVIAFDPNIRPALFPDTGQIPKIISAGAALADIVLPSFDDELAAFGDSDPAATAVRYHAAGASIVAVKNGADDVLISASGQHTLLAVPKASKIVDTTSAGDAFNATFLSALALGSQLPDAAKKAIQVAQKVIGGPGALVADIKDLSV